MIKICFLAQLIITCILSGIHESAGRNHKLGAHLLLKRQPYYFDDGYSALDQNDEVCPTLTNGKLVLMFGVGKCVAAFLFNNEVLLVPIYKFACYQVNNTIFTLQVRQMYEAEPPNPCPVIEAEIILRPELTDIKCSLLWDKLNFGNGYVEQHTIYPACRGVDKPDSNADINPKRIFTLIPQPETVLPDGVFEFVPYKMCPNKNTSCGELGIAVTEFGFPSEIVLGVVY